MKKLAFLFALLCVASVKAQTVSPLGATAFQQYFDNSGKPLVNGALYFFVAGTSTQAPTYNDPAGTILNANPLPLSTGGRVNAWLVTTQLYKILLCASATDGPFCSAGNILAVADQVPGGSAGGGSGSCASGCTGFLISGTASPATSGVLRMASGDSFGWRNAAGSANLLFSKDPNDQLGWAGGSVKFPLVGAPSCIAGFTQLWADNSANRWKMCNNGGTATQVVASGNDISNTDSVTAVHFGASQAPFSSTLPSTNQVLAWNGSTIVGASIVPTTYSTASSSTNASIAAVTMATAGASGNTYRFSFYVDQTALGSGCTGSTTVQILMTWTDPQSSSTASSGNTFTISGNGTVGNNSTSAGLVTVLGATRAKASTAVQYSVTYTAGTGCSTGPSYQVYPILEQLQ